MTARRVIELDNRGLPPPQPMLRILDTLDQCGDGVDLIARNDREPLFLYPELEERGWLYETEPLPDGSYQVHIWKG